MAGSGTGSLDPVLLPEPQDAVIALAATFGAYAAVGGLDDIQLAVIDEVADRIYGLDLEDHPIEPWTTDAVLAQDPPVEVRQQAVHLMVILELVAHPLATDAARAVEDYAHAIGVHSSLLDDGRRLAEHHIALMYADLQRSSWYTEQTIKGSLHGRLTELVRSKLAYTGIAPDRAIAERWEGLRDLPTGSWGRAVADFYERHHFPFPGERHGIYEIGARHDFVHVLTDYDATPEGELDVFAFIAACMSDEKGLVLLAVTLGLFQNGSIRHVAGKKVKIARTDTLEEPGAGDRWAEALHRGQLCPVDVMGGIDHFALAPLPIDEVRNRLGVVGRTLPDPD